MIIFNKSIFIIFNLFLVIFEKIKIPALNINLFRDEDIFFAVPLLVLYLSYEEGVNQTFQRRMEYLKMNEVQGKFRVVVDETYEELIDRLKKPKSPKFIIVDSYQVSEWEYPDTVALMKRFPKKCFIWISQEKKSQPMGGGAIRLRYICDMKIRVVGYKAYCQGRAIGEAGSYYVVWEEGIIQTSNNL